MLWYNKNRIEGNNMKKKIIVHRLVILILIIIALMLTLYFLLLKKPMSKIFVNEITGFVTSSNSKVELYTLDFKESEEIVRGIKIKIKEEEIKDEKGNKYYQLVDKNILIKKENFTKNEKDIVPKTDMYVRTYLTLYKSEDTSEILSTINKGKRLEILGYDKLLEDGSVHKYKIKYGDLEGYVYGKYLVSTYDEAIKNYDEENTHAIHSNCGDAYGVGTAKNLDFYPVSKPKFEDNVMPDEVRALYLNTGVVKDVDKYIEFAKKTKINAFVVDIKDNTSPGYESDVMKKYSPKNYKYANNSFETYKQAIKELKDNGFYVIGRITVFKDSYFVSDHPETAILDTATNMPFLHNGSYWPSAFNRLVWEFNVELAKEAVVEMGFDEIQFDYVRFPDQIYSLEKNGKIDMRNEYDEEKAQAIQKFLMYASDEIHEVGAYVSADVFGESAHNYVTGYGQYWPAISNVVDVISAMPYPDHFSSHEYNISEVVWTVPYKVLTTWGEFALNRQKSIPTPAIVRTWIQAYDTMKSPKVEYNSSMVSLEIEALVDSGLTGGFMTWNSISSLNKYSSLKDAFNKEYVNE